jgi:tRNA1Val (adenine37-N6)-methyltransferase
MSNPYFAFRQFTIHHDRTAMKVGTDGVLLGAWVNVTRAERILDVGTGTGLIAIMCAQRSEARIDAVEIDQEAYGQAIENSRACIWQDRISIYLDSLQHFASVTKDLFDVIVSNPPYFRDSLKSPVQSRSLARHDEKLTYESLVFYGAKILSPGGLLAVILPAQECERFVSMAFFHDLHPARITLVRPHAGKQPARCLAEFSRDKDQSCITGELNIKELSGQYTDAFRQLTREFYLKM